jgi:glycerol-3-phosphate dehydrogenase
MDPARAEVLLERYGTRAQDVMAFLRKGDDRLLESTAELSVRELAYMAEHEQIGHLIDVLIRRTSLAFRGLVTLDVVREIAQELAPFLGWDGELVSAEVDDALRTLALSHSAHADTLGYVRPEGAVNV